MARDGRLEIFKGVTPKPTRDYLRRVFEHIRGRYKRMIIPCAGRFTVAQLACAAGWKAADIETSDISLFSSVLGRHASGSDDLEDLQIQFSDTLAHLEAYRGTPKFAAAVLYGIKWAQLAAGKTYYIAAMRDELASSPETYIDAFAERLIAMRSAIGGIQYRVADIFAQLDRFRDDGEAVVFADPPVYKGSYGKQFDATAEHIKWVGIELPEFDPDSGANKLSVYARTAKPLTMWYRLWEVDPEEQPFITFGHEIKAGHVKYTLVSRPAEVEITSVPRPVSKVSSGNWTILAPSHPLNASSTIRCHQSDRATALYYRELFAHKLGATRADRYFIFTVDGYLFGVVGTIVRDALRRRLTTKGPPAVGQLFAFTTPSRYGRLSKLLMRCVTCEQFREEMALVDPPLAYVADLAMSTTCIASVPEVKSVRGIFKLVDRSRRSDGRYQITYRTNFHAGKYPDMLEKWLKTDGRVTKNEEAA